MDLFLVVVVVVAAVVVVVAVVVAAAFFGLVAAFHSAGSSSFGAICKKSASACGLRLRGLKLSDPEHIPCREAVGLRAKPRNLSFLGYTLWLLWENQHGVI